MSATGVIRPSGLFPDGASSVRDLISSKDDRPHPGNVVLREFIVDWRLPDQYMRGGSAIAVLSFSFLKNGCDGLRHFGIVTTTQPFASLPGPYRMSRHRATQA